MPFNLGPAELIIIMALALLVFGPKKLPEIGRGIGNALREFNKARNDFMESIHSETDRDEYRPPQSAPYSSDTTVSDSQAALAPPADRKLEFPQAPDLDSADALPYGTDFHAVEGDSQPSFRTAPPEAVPVSTAAKFDSVSPSAEPVAGGTSERKG